MTRAEWYAAGYARGEQYAEDDLHEHAPASDRLEEWRALVRNTIDRDGVGAFYLGALRGYRALTRTQLAGRWGT